MLELERLINASLQLPHHEHSQLGPLNRTHRLSALAQKEHRLKQFMKLIRDPLKEAKKKENYCEDQNEIREERERKEQNTLSFQRNWKPSLASEVTIEGQGLRDGERKVRRFKTEVDSSYEWQPSNQLVLKFPQLSLVKEALHIRESRFQSKEQLQGHAKLPSRKKHILLPLARNDLNTQLNKRKRVSLNQSAMGGSWQQRQTQISGWTVNDLPA